MNEIVNRFLLARDKSMPEMHLNLDLTTVLVVHLLKKKKERTKKIKETRDSWCIHQNDLGKAVVNMT